MTLKKIKPKVPLFDVVAVDIERRTVTELVATARTERNAEAIETMAVMRRGVDKVLFSIVPAAKYKVGSKWRG